MSNENLYRAIDPPEDLPRDIVVRAYPTDVVGHKCWVVRMPDKATYVVGDGTFQKQYEPLTEKEVRDHYQNTNNAPDVFINNNDGFTVNWRALKYIGEKQCNNGSGFYLIVEDSWRQFAAQIEKAMVDLSRTIN